MIAFVLRLMLLFATLSTRGLVFGFGGICLKESYWTKNASFDCPKSRCSSTVEKDIKSAQACCNACGADFKPACLFWSFNEKTRKCTFFETRDGVKYLRSKPESGTVSSSIGQSPWFNDARGIGLYGSNVLVANYDRGGAKSTVTRCKVDVLGQSLKSCQGQSIPSKYGSAFALAIDAQEQNAYLSGRRGSQGLFIGCKIKSNGYLKSCKTTSPTSDGPYWNNVSGMSAKKGYVFALNAGSSVKKQGWVDICRVSNLKLSQCSYENLYGKLGIATGIYVDRDTIYIGHTMEYQGYVLNCVIDWAGTPSLKNCKNTEVPGVIAVGGVAASGSSIYVSDRYGDTISVCDLAVNTECRNNNAVKGNTNNLKLPGNIIPISKGGNTKIIVTNTGVADSISMCSASAKCSLASPLQK